MAKNHTIYIIGFMGSGKTTTGKKLASLLQWSFIDLDRKIEEHTGDTITEIFAKKGEAYFRNLESTLLKSIDYQSNIVISTGGGTPCHSDNMDFMLNSGLTLYLKLTPEELKSRLSESKGERPLIKDLVPEKLLSFIEEKLAYREKWYNRSDLIVEGTDPDINLLCYLVKSRMI